MPKLVQMNMSVSPGFVAEVDALRKRHGWSKRMAVEVAIHALAQSTGVMDAHARYADQHDAEIGDLYMRLAREMPAGFVEAPKDGVRVGHSAGMPAVVVR